MDKILTVKKEKLYSFIWTVPIVALIIAGTLIYRSHFNKGPEITLILSKADGIEAGKTAIKALSVNVGKIESISLSPDRKNVVAIARMNPGTDDLIRDDSRFWIQKVRIDRQGVSGLDTLLSGYYIELSPGNSPKPARMFTVLDDPPLATDDRGLYLTLHSESLKKVSPGSILKFKGIEAGHVLDANYDFDKQIMTYRVFVPEPYSRLIDSGIVRMTLYPFEVPTQARPTPVFPLVGSMITESGFKSPFASASLIMYQATRSFKLPAGLNHSNFARISATSPFASR